MPTKHRPRWSKLQSWVVVFAATCLCVSPVPAASAVKSLRHAAKSAVFTATKKTASPTKLLKARPSSSSPFAQKQAPLPHDPVGGPGFFGAASFYGYGFQGRRVATGERFDVRGMTAACNHVPLGTWVAVRRSDSGACVVAKVNDRMHVKHRIRVIDLSRGAAEQLRMIAAGVVMVRVAPLNGAPHGDLDKVCQAAFSGGGEDSGSVELPIMPPKLPNLYDLLRKEESEDLVPY